MGDDKRPARDELRRMLSTLFQYRSQEKEAKRNGDAFVADNAARLIRQQYAIIRTHCANHGLDLPHDVPAVGDGGHA